MEYSKVPGKVLIEITNQCNLDCKYCYVVNEADNEISFDVLKKLFKEMATFNIPRVVISGGEPLSRPERLKLLKKYNFPDITLRTNGALINNENIELIKNLNFKNIVVSLDGHTVQLHNKYRNKFKKCINGVKKLIKTNISVDIGVVVTTNNFKFIPEMNEYFKKLKVNSVNYQVVFNDNDENNEIILTKKQKDWLRDFVKTENQRNNNFKVLTSLELINKENLFKTRADNKYPLFSCAAPSGAIYLSGSGDTYPCVRLADLISSPGNIKQEPLIAIWNSARLLINLRQTIAKKGQTYCNNCFLLTECKFNCPADILRKAKNINKLPLCWQEVLGSDVKINIQD